MSVDTTALSQACERNKDPILALLRPLLGHARQILEIGSGTGQHAIYFAGQLPHVLWQPSDTHEYLPLLRRALQPPRPANLLEAIELDVRERPWAVRSCDAAFSANTLHIMDWSSVGEFFRGVGAVLETGGILCVYGPFRYGGRYTSDSNAAFDRFLQERDPRSGIRDFDAVDALAQAQGLRLEHDHAMPANNQFLVWRKESASGGIHLAERQG